LGVETLLKWDFFLESNRRKLQKNKAKPPYSTRRWWYSALLE